MEVKHVQTVVQTTFGIVDGDNVIPQPPLTAQITRFDRKSFANAHDVIAAQRDEVIAETEAQRTEAERVKRARQRKAARRPKR